MVERRGSVLVALCADLEGHGLPPGAVASLVEAAGPPAAVVEDLCHGPDRLEEAMSQSGTDRAVVAACPGGPSAEELQAWARRAAVDPFALEPVNVVAAASLGPPGSEVERAALILRARAAGVAAQGPSRPERLRLRAPGGAVSRRTLLSLGPLAYEPVAAIVPERCLGTDRCGLCTGACPVGAIRAARPHPIVAKDACVACGACLTSCPVDAVGLPTADRGRYEAELAALLEGPPAVVEKGPPPGLLLACRRAPPTGLAVEDGADWLPVEVPCLSMVTPGWVLGGLAAGFPSVTLRGCGESCRARGVETVREGVDHVRRILETLGDPEPSARVGLSLPEVADPPEALRRVPDTRFGAGPPLAEPSLAEPAATAGALLRLAGGRPASLASPASPLGTLRVLSEGCTLCGLCPQVCPTEAVSFEEGPVVATLTFDAARCVACGHCADICPERVLKVERSTDVGELVAGRRTLKADTVSRCRRCGRPVAPAAMLARIRELLPDQPEGLMASLTDLCLDCRGLTVPASAHDPVPPRVADT